MMFTRDELKQWLLAIEKNNIDNILGYSCEIIIGRLDGFEQFVKDLRKEVFKDGRI